VPSKTNGSARAAKRTPTKKARSQRSARRDEPAPAVEKRPSPTAHELLDLDEAHRTQRGAHGLLLDAWVEFRLLDDPRARAMAEVLNVLCDLWIAPDLDPALTSTRAGDDGAVAWARRTKKRTREAFNVHPTRAEAARELVRLVGRLPTHARPLQAAIFMHPVRHLFELPKQHPEAAAVRIRNALSDLENRENAHDSEIVAKTVLRACGMTEGDAANVIKSAMSSVR